MQDRSMLQLPDLRTSKYSTGFTLSTTFYFAAFTALSMNAFTDFIVDLIF